MVTIGTLQVGSATYKAIIGLTHQHGILLIVSRGIKVVMHILHPLPQALVERDAVEVLAEHGSHAIAHLHQRIIGIGREHGIKHAQHTVQCRSSTVEGYDGVLECRFGLVAGNGLDLGFVLLNATADGRLIIGRRDAVKRD